MRTTDGGVENESKGWGSEEREQGMGEWIMRARDGGVENESEGLGE